ncbi:ABC transporter substrate-binding protein [Gloeocapsopsis crepidinum LEGE 06123]|uniref:ABC transporter substrate-binding protein n=1 Tax=Gloeocapsopsis crepidinum LEGE 06123 TaxID=588587 RepID=A0ABR9USS2_9CHRO|nr:ABC transporter substrate-binding protein [Gloeocapsopsis crepidinum]MBE9191352.1 ABC transporter substrate-binding protein [Gloeocapsopsis crepidinum LEGE 06123]
MHNSKLSSFQFALNRRKFLKYGSLALGTGLLSACVGTSNSTTNAGSTSSTTFSKLNKVILGTSWFAQAEHGGFYQAVATGLYQKHGLDVSINMGGSQVNGNQLLMAGTIDFKMGYAIEAIKAIESGLPKITVAAMFQKDPQALLTHPNAGNDRFEDLKGKKILLSTIAHTTFWPFLKQKYGYSDSQIGVYTFNVGSFVADKSLVQQGYITSEPHKIEQEGGFKPVELLMANHGYTPYSSTIETKRELVESNPDLVQRFVDASIKGWYSYLEDPAPANVLIKQDNPEMTDEQLAHSLSKIKEYGIVKSGDAETFGIGAMTQERWTQIYTDMVEAKVFNPNVNYQEAFTLDFVNKSVDAYV